MCIFAEPEVVLVWFKNQHNCKNKLWWLQPWGDSRTVTWQPTSYHCVPWYSVLDWYV